MFVPDIIEYAFVGVSLSDAKCILGGGVIQINHAPRFTNVCACQITGVCAII